MRVMTYAFGGAVGLALGAVTVGFMIVIPSLWIGAWLLREIPSRLLGGAAVLLGRLKDRLDRNAAEDLQDEIAELVIAASKGKGGQPWRPDGHKVALHLGRREVVLLGSKSAQDVRDYLYGRYPDNNGFFDRWGVLCVEYDPDHESIVYLEELEES